MRNPDEELERLKAVCAGAELWYEAENQPLVYLPDYGFHAIGKSHRMDALLCPRQHSSAGYPTRLFLEKKIGTGGNWNIFNVKGRSWHARSWEKVSADQPWINILAAHLGNFE